MSLPEIANLFAPLPSAARGEVFTELLARPGARIERIVSGGQATPCSVTLVSAERLIT